MSVHVRTQHVSDAHYMNYTSARALKRIIDVEGNACYQYQSDLGRGKWHPIAPTDPTETAALH
jgi:hypothetical protein